MHHRREAGARLLALVAIMLGLGWVNGSATARAGSQEDELVGVDDTTYESPSWGFTLDWDEDDWEVIRATSDDDVDVLFLSGDDGGLFIQGIPFRGDVESCRDAIVDALQNEDGVDDWEPLDDDDGGPIADEEDNRAFAAFSLTFTGSDGASQDRANYVECRELVEDEAALTILLIAPLDDYEDAIDAAEPVLDSISLAEDADEDDDDASEEERPGREEESFVSEKYGFALTWSTPWAVRLEIVSGDPDGVDQLVLTNGTSTVVLSGVTGYDGDPAECLEAMEEAIRDDRDNDDVELGEGDDGDPLVGEDDDRAYALFIFDRGRGGIVPVPPDSSSTFTGPSGETAHYVECRTLEPGESVLIIGHDVPLDDYQDEAEEREDLLDGLERTTDSGAISGEDPAATSCEDWFVDTRDRTTRGFEFSPRPTQSATIPEAIEFAEGYRGLTEEQEESNPPAEAEELNALVVEYLKAMSEYWRFTAESMQNPGDFSLLAQATDELILALSLGGDISIEAQLIAAECGLDEREFVLP